MRQRGSITIYLSLILLSIILLISVVSESARVNVVQTKSKDYTYMATESVMAGYAKQVYEDYGILLVWEKESAKEQVKKYIQANINMADLEGKAGYNFMAAGLIDVEVKGQEYVTDHEGEKFLEQMKSYMKYAGALETVESLIQKFHEYSEGESTEAAQESDVAKQVEQDSEELQNLVKEINKKVTDIKNTAQLREKTDTVNQKFNELQENLLSAESKGHDRRVKQFMKRYKKLMAELEVKSGNADSVMELIKEYEKQKKLFLKKHKYTADAGDYLDANRKKLESAKSNIKRIEELAVSDFSDIGQYNLNTVTQSLKYVEDATIIWESLNVNKATEEDEKKESLYRQVSDFLSQGVLSIVVDDTSKLSKNTISLSNLPTSLKKGKSSSGALKTTTNKAVLSLYAGMKFGNYLSQKSDTALKYEMEYIIGGKDSDRDNLVNVVEKITAARNVVNLAYLVSDREKMGEISAVAAAVAAVTGLPFMEPVAKAILIEAWALAESVSDVKVLLKGEKIPLAKSKKTWNTSLTNLGKTQKKSYKKGIDYKTNLELLIMMQGMHKNTYRVMDLIQVNIQKRYNKNFVMSQCFQSLNVTANYQTRQIFTAMPSVIGALASGTGAYKYQIESSYAY